MTVSGDELTALLFRHDLVGLAGNGAPTDEYAPEAGSIAARLAEAASVQDVQRIVQEDFESWFFPGVADPEAYARVAADIWARQEGTDVC